MSSTNPLLEAYNRTAYPLIGHGKRNIQVLKDVLNELDGDMDSDVYGKGALIEDFQNKIAKLLGKEAAVFFPSGTMAQQIAMRIWSEKKGIKRVAYHPLSHLEIHEEEGLKHLHGIESVLLADKDRLIQIDDVRNMDTNISCLLLELPQREIGGELPSYEELEAISAFCREKGITLHLDGARLLEVLPYYQKSAEEICSLFDSVYISFYKGVGGIAGAILAGDDAFVKESVIWKRRHGGDLISLYPYILSADHYFSQRQDRFNQYYEDAKELASLYNQCDGIKTRPVIPVSNMFHIHFSLPKAKVEPVLISVYEETGVGFITRLNHIDEETSYCEVNIGDQYAGISKEVIHNAFQILNQRLQAVLQEK
ncbi:threonine aldolase family protein [Brevibacillus sp. SIMBA_040]|uniref:threonine aldolase family protein n=1 Tax=unclassified Brevibacillus TaxID=2684853 RepID=UPI00397BAE60